jgi:DNA-binding MarR family transcriptional regulator
MTSNPTSLITLGRRHGISPSAIHILALMIEEGAMLPRDLAACAMTTSANITGLLKRLRRDGWAERLPITDATDQRIHPHGPTEKARQAFTSILTP